jgi:hypothetical protein
MFTQIQTYNDKAQVTGPAFKKLILDRLPTKILEQMHTVDLTGRTNEEIVDVITKAGKTAEKWEAARKNLALRSLGSKRDHKEKSRFDKPQKDRSYQKDKHRRSKKDKKLFKDKSFKKSSSKGKSDLEGIDRSEIDRRKSAGECLRCAWPSDRKGAHRVKDCRRAIKTDKGTADFPKAKEYQKMKIAAVEVNSTSDDSTDEYSESSSNEESEESESTSGSGSDSEDSEAGSCYDESQNSIEEESSEGNWWDSEKVSE